MRQYGSFNPGKGVGGAAIHWRASTGALPADFQYRSHVIKRYGEEDARRQPIQDWGITYDELEPYYDAIDYDIGVSGKAGNSTARRSRRECLRGAALARYPSAATLVASARTSPKRPTPRLSPVHAAGRDHSTLQGPRGNERGGCLYCGFCTRYGCEVDAKASSLVTHMPAALATGKYEIRPNATFTHRHGGTARDRRQLHRRARTSTSSRPNRDRLGLHTENTRCSSSPSKPHPSGVGNDHGLVGKNYTYQSTRRRSPGSWKASGSTKSWGTAARSLSTTSTPTTSTTRISTSSAARSCTRRRRARTRRLGRRHRGSARHTWGQDWKDGLQRTGNARRRSGSRARAYPMTISSSTSTRTTPSGLPAAARHFDWHENHQTLGGTSPRKRSRS